MYTHADANLYRAKGGGLNGITQETRRSASFHTVYPLDYLKSRPHGVGFISFQTTWSSNVREEKVDEVVVEIGSVKFPFSVILIHTYHWCSQTLVETLPGYEWVKCSPIVDISLTLMSRGRYGKITCPHCQKPSPRVFVVSWACLIPDCPMFWIQAEGTFKGQYFPDKVDYCPSFLELPPSQPLPPGFESVGHAEGSTLEIIPTNIITTYALSKGFHCGKCGRLSCRCVLAWFIGMDDHSNLFPQISMGALEVPKLWCQSI